MRHSLDKETLRASFVKVRPVARPSASLELSPDEFVPPAHVAAEERAILERSAALARQAIATLQASSPDETAIRAAFALGLYRIRAQYCRQDDVANRHAALQGFLERFVTGDDRSIRVHETSKRAFDMNRSTREARS
jgi:hypothetical protein